ncbi:MAG: DUF4292 domain-containing protein [Proteobacteria bacterium]|nr:DUF4292 domain-containing protein [Pseudomonadota bacterium]
MRGSRRKPFQFLWVFIALIPLLFMACGGRRPALDLDPFHLKNSGIALLPQSEAEEIFQRLSTTNLELKSIKGLGKAKVQSEKENFSSRLAWTADDSGRIRLEVIRPDGRSLLSLSTDGAFMYFYSHGEKKFYKKRVKDKNLGDYLGIPLNSHELTGILSGRIPGLNRDQMVLTENREGDGYILHLFEKNSRKTTLVFLNAEKQTVVKLERRKFDGTISYQILFDHRKTVNGFPLPFYLLVVDGKASSFQLEMDRVWINPAIEDKLFILSEPES